MLESLLLSQVLLWIIVMILAVICLALIRQVGILYERIAPAGALAMNQRLTGGDLAPALSVITVEGQPISIGPRGNITDQSTVATKSQLLFFLSPTCPICKTLLPVLKSLNRNEKNWLDIILASDGDDEAAHQAFIKKQALTAFPYVLSEPLGLTYGVSKLPYAVLIDEHGVISALGMINSREHLESLLEAKRLGVASIQDYLDAEAEIEAEDSSAHSVVSSH